MWEPVDDNPVSQDLAHRNLVPLPIEGINLPPIDRVKINHVSTGAGIERIPS
jgi:hypothetical protein